MPDQPSGPVPDPTGVNSVAELVDRLRALQSWAGPVPAPAADAAKPTASLASLDRSDAAKPTASLASLDRSDAPGSVEAFVAACLRARGWLPADVDREVARWQAAVRRVAPAPGAEAGPAGTDVTQELARVVDAGEAVLGGDAAPTSPATPVSAAPWRTARRRRLAVAAAVAVALVLLSVPVLVVRLSASPAPDVVAPVSTGPLLPPPTSTAAQPDPTSPPRDPAARAMRPSDTEPTEAAPPAVTSAPDRPAATTPSGTGWSTIVDNTTAGRFRASGNWGRSTDSGQRYGSNFRYARPVEASDPAWYKVNIPANGRYRVDVWFPAKAGYNERTPYIVATTTGNQTIHISQKSGGGRWVTLGTFALAAGDADVVAVSRWRTSGTGYVIADAIRVTRA